MGQGGWHQEVYWGVQSSEARGGKKDKSRARQISLETSRVQWATEWSQEKEGDWIDNGRVPGRRGQKWGRRFIKRVGFGIKEEEDRGDKYRSWGGGARKENKED